MGVDKPQYALGKPISEGELSNPWEQKMRKRYKGNNYKIFCTVSEEDLVRQNFYFFRTVFLVKEGTDGSIDIIKKLTSDDISSIIEGHNDS